MTYEDKFGAGKTESAVTENSVEAKTRANAAPSFLHLDEDKSTATVSDVSRAVNEGENGVNVGKPVMARDADNDVLLYSIVAAGRMDDGVGGGDIEATDLTDRFSIDPRSGQLKTKVDSLDSDDDGLMGTADATDGEATYTVTVTAMDPSGASGEATVTITITDINDDPKITAGTAGVGNRKELTVAENVVTSDTDGDLDADPTDAAIDDPTYTATDDDAGDVITGGNANDAPPSKDIVYAIEGADKGAFRLINNAGVQTLAFKTDHKVNYEKQKSYSISIVAKRR